MPSLTQDAIKRGIHYHPATINAKDCPFAVMESGAIVMVSGVALAHQGYAKSKDKGIVGSLQARLLTLLAYLNSHLAGGEANGTRNWVAGEGRGKLTGADVLIWP
ncbi:hypothetical protein PtA15_15A154 [Puccinia triticina]|uniref:Uncharacterized protein n=1 Tax=Puccinia triticina TaxID=208348 RepID=A0ABY7D505_9BASI|nr:uncharacterized protein PtA15_15A154 [Puccinia triticina]WAQ91762.1 hypothetical protein PtA15_15A154 [Puccinia triticina]